MHLAFVFAEMRIGFGFVETRATNFINLFEVKEVN
jgi:hypothetical protein